jgi:hypothetical protein
MIFMECRNTLHAHTFEYLLRIVRKVQQARDVHIVGLLYGGHHYKLTVEVKMQSARIYFSR